MTRRARPLLPLVWLTAAPLFAAPSADGPLAVTLAPSRAVQAASTEEVTGSLFPERSLPLGFEVGGRLVKVRVQKGEKVKAGQLLAQLDPEVVDAQVAQAEAAVAAAEAGSAMATDMAARNEKLLEEGSVSDVQSRSASTGSKQAAAQLLAAKAQLAQAKAARKRHQLHAPFDATVVEAPEQIGATVGPGMPLFVLAQLDVLVLKTTVAENTARALTVGSKVKVTSVASGVSTEAARIRTLVPAADPSTRRVPVEIRVPNPEGRLIANTLAKALLTLGEQQAAQAVPTTAVSSTGGDHVFVVGPDQTLKKVPVTVVERGKKEVVVTAQERLGQVVDYPTARLVEGAKVSIR